MIIPERFPALTLDKFLYLVRDVHDGQIRCVVTFSSQLDAERIARAVRLTLDAEPVLGCRFIRRFWRPFWERRPDLDHIPHCPLVKTQNLESELHTFMAERLDPCVDHQVQVCLFRSDRDTLCIKTNHMVTDAMGTIEYVCLLARIYRELRINPAYCPQPNLNGSRGLGQVFKHVGFLTLIRALTRFRCPWSYWGFPKVSQDFSGGAFTTRRLGPDRFAHIKAYCRKHRVSVNDILLTAFYRVLFEELDIPANASLPIQVTINLRRYIPSGRAAAICNLTCIFFPAVKRKQEEFFEKTSAKVHAVMEAAKSNHPWLGAALGLKMLFLPGFSVLSRIIQYLKTRQMISDKLHMFANIGVIDPGKFDFGDSEIIDVSMFGPVAYPPGFLLSINTFAETMIVTTSFCDTAMDARTVNHFIDRYVSTLPE